MKTHATTNEPQQIILMGGCYCKEVTMPLPANGRIRIIVPAAITARAPTQETTREDPIVSEFAVRLDQNGEIATCLGMPIFDCDGAGLE